MSCLFKKSEGDELGNISEDVKAQINECSEKRTQNDLLFKEYF